MDLSERESGTAARHPWETARLAALEELLGRLPLRGARVLDVGCGDAYLLGELQRRLGFGEALAHDTSLSEELCAELARPGVRFIHSLEEVDGAGVDLLLLLDVLEHVERPVGFLEPIVTEQLRPGGLALITVPAFQTLFTEHDRQLRHYRRYTRWEIARVAELAGLVVLDAGYLFASLLLPRGLEALRERALGAPAPGRRGIGRWRAPRAVTAALHHALCWDNRLCLFAHGLGFSPPGLSAWLICRKPG